ncbi:MAG: DUF456 domain-containing protein [Schleiferiaceae bacterium]|jgi:uncharacterized protein YqgC (DUF456 family)
MELLVWILLISGVAGAVLPMVPGPILTAVALFLALISDQINGTLYWFFVVSGIIIFLIDFFMPAYLTKKSGASRRASNGALIGMILSLFTGPGLFLGAFIGAFIGEFSITSDATKSARASLYAVLGVFTGMAVKLFYTLAMLVLYISHLYL